MNGLALITKRGGACSVSIQHDEAIGPKGDLALKSISLCAQVYVMKDNETKARFVELRGQGPPLKKIADEIGVSKTKLVNGNRTSRSRSTTSGQWSLRDSTTNTSSPYARKSSSSGGSKSPFMSVPVLHKQFGYMQNTLSEDSRNSLEKTPIPL